MDEVISLINKIYEWSDFSERIATIFWVIFVFQYVIILRYEKAHDLLHKRKLYKVNYHGMLFIFGLGSAMLHYGSRHLGWTFMAHLVVAEKFSHLFFAGFTFMSLGLYLVCAARIAINGYWGVHIYKYEPDPTTGQQGKLITGGIYRYSRHPIYTGQIFMTLGTMMLANNWWFAIFPTGTTALSLVRAFREDVELRERFGCAYQSYKNATSFLVPWIT